VDHEFSIVGLTPAHVPAVVELCRAALDLPEDAAEAEQIVARLRETGPVAGVARRTVGLVALGGGDDGAVAARDVVGAVLGSSAHRDPSVGHVDLVAVHPEQRRRGIGRALLSRVEGALAALGAGEVLLAGNPPVYAWPGIDVRYTPAVCAAMALGYEQDRTAWNMTADLSYEDSPALRSTDEAEKRLAAEGVTVRRAEPADVDALVAFARREFGNTWGAEIADSIGRPGAGCHVALRGAEILGFAAYGSSRPSWFGPMGTAHAARGLGVGGALLRRCLRDQHAAGVRRSEIGWVGPVPFYARNAGARIERVFFLYRKQL
jgi:predicted N-acetyltransferase YhbS